MKHFSMLDEVKQEGVDLDNKRFVAHMGTSKIMSKAFQEIAPVLVPFLSDACEMNLLLAFKDLPEICNVFFLRPSSMSQSRTR